MNVDPSVLQRLVAWAEGKDSVIEVWVFGSRAKETNKSDSDLDVGIVLHPEDEKPLAEWVEYGDEWEKELNTLIDEYVIDLEHAWPGQQEVVWPAIEDHGIQIYAMIIGTDAIPT